MPKELETDDPSLVQGTSFVMERNDEMNEAQATETHKVKAKEGHSVGTGGEKVGFAKYQVNGLISEAFELQKQRTDFYEKQVAPVEEVLKPLHEEIHNLEQSTRETNATLERLKSGNNLSEEDKRLQENPLEVEALESKLKMDAEKLDLLKQKAKPLEQQYEPLNRKMDKFNNDIYGVVANKAKFLNDAAYLYKDKDNVEQGTFSPDDDLGLLTRSVTSSSVGQLLATNRSTTAEERFGVDSEGKVIGVSIQADGAGVNSDIGDPKKQAFLDINYRDPNIQRGLSDLSVDDYITGQMDRHPGNIFIDPSNGNVTGIDNDLAFPEISRDQLIADRGAAFKGTVGIPSQISSEKAAKILATTPEDLERAIRETPRPKNAKPLSDDAIQGAKDRLVQLQNAIKDPKSGVKVISKFNDKTYDAAIQEQAEAFNNSPTTKKGIEFGKVSEKPTGFDFKAYDGCPKTSYLGSIEIARVQKQMALKSPGEAENHTLRDGKSVTKASREPDLDKGLKEIAQSKQTMLKNPGAMENKVLGGEIDNLKKSMAPLKKEADKLQQKIEKLEKPGFFTRLKERVVGNDDARMKKIAGLRDDQQQALQKLNPLEKQLDQKLEEAVAPQKAELEKQMQKKQGVGEKKGVSVKEGMEQKQKLKMDNVIGELKQSGAKLKDTNPELVQREGESTNKRNSVKLNN